MIRITGETGKSGTDERVTDGSVVAEKRSNVRGAKGPYCFATIPTTWEARVK